MPIIHANDISKWASRIEGRYALGELVGRLVKSYIPLSVLRFFRFPSHEAATLPGWDGQLHHESPNPHRYISPGYSVWEFGTDEDGVAKVRRDFEKKVDGRAT